MTAHDDHSPKARRRGLGPARANGAAPPGVAPPPAVVPITVWRLDDLDDDRPVAEGDAGFGSRLARRLVEVYTEAHQTIADLDDEPCLQDAARSAARSYRAITDPADLTDGDTPASAVSLVVCRWPRPGKWPTKPSTLFTACRLIMSRRSGCVLAALRCADPDQPGTSHAEHAATLIGSAETAGFRHVLQIVAVGGCGDGDQFLYYATDVEAAQAAAPAADRRVCHIDLLAFTPVGRRD